MRPTVLLHLLVYLKFKMLLKHLANRYKSNRIRWHPKMVFLVVLEIECVLKNLACQKFWIQILAYWPKKLAIPVLGGQSYGWLRGSVLRLGQGVGRKVSSTFSVVKLKKSMAFQRLLSTKTNLQIQPHCSDSRTHAPALWLLPYYLLTFGLTFLILNFFTCFTKQKKGLSQIQSVGSHSLPKTLSCRNPYSSRSIGSL